MYIIPVYLDDFIGAVVGNAIGMLLSQITVAALHVICSTPPPQKKTTSHIG